MPFLAPLAPALPWITAGVAVAGAGIGAAGAVQAGRAGQQASEFNAAVARQQAEREKQVGALQAEQFSRAQQRLLATSRASRSASGVTFAGTPMLVDEAAVDEIAYNEALIRSGAEVKATRLEQEAMLEGFRGRAARTSGMFRAGGTLLAGAYNVAAPFVRHGSTSTWF